MSEPPYAHVKTDRRFESGWNTLQVAIELGVAFVVVAGLLGAFGSGPLSSARAMLENKAVTIDYERIVRRTSQTDMTLNFAAPARQVEVELPNSFLHDMDIVSTSPRSSAMRTQAHGVTYVFDVGDPAGAQITLSMKAKGVGVANSPFRIDGAPVTLHQIIWP